MRTITHVAYLRSVLLLVTMPVLLAAPATVRSDQAAENASSQANARLELSLRDAQTGRPVFARVRVRDESRRDHVPPGATVVRIGARDRWFVCPGDGVVDVPAGSIDVRVERGTEYRPWRGQFQVRSEEPLRQAIQLERWVNMRERGYVCGENHLHAGAEDLAPQLLAEGLDFGTSLQWWNGPQYKVASGEGFVRTIRLGDQSVPVSVYDYEIEHAWGAVYVLGLPEPLQAGSDPRRPNLPLVRQARDAGALICYQGGWSPEVLLDALLGCVDVVNVCNNNFHRHQFQPRSRYSNLLGVERFPVYPDTPEGMMQLNAETYYRLLNCGLRLAAGAGSATGAKNTPVGYNRSYVRAGSDPGLPEFLEAWRAGRNFVTNGPMLLFSVAHEGEHGPGDVIELSPGSDNKMTLRVEAFCEQALTSLEVVRNGQVIAAADKVSGSRAELVFQLDVREPCWLAARCTERDDWLSDSELARDHDYGGRLPCKPNRLRFAHTSPIYVTMGGKGVRQADAVEQARRMLEAFEAFSLRHAGEEYRSDLAAAVDEARRRLAD